MATVPVKPTADTPATETVEERFRRLEAAWTAEVGHFSSPTVLCGHPAFREIIGLGEAVVPLMLRDLEERPRLWVLGPAGDHRSQPCASGRSGENCQDE